MSKFAFEIDPNHLAWLDNVYNSGFQGNKCAREFLVTPQSPPILWPIWLDSFLSPVGCAEGKAKERSGAVHWDMAPHG